MKFVKGQSGNPAGRPKGTTTKEICQQLRDHVPAAVERLLQLMNSEDEGISLKATLEILNRGFGKPVEQTSYVHEDKGPFGY
jgi:hypothetical protein